MRLDGPSVRTLHVNLDDALKEESDQDDELARISGIKRPEFPEPTYAARAGLGLRGGGCNCCYFATAIPVIVHVTKPTRDAPVASRCSNHAWVPVTTAGPSSAGLSIIVRKLANLQANEPITKIFPKIGNLVLPLNCRLGLVFEPQQNRRLATQRWFVRREPHGHRRAQLQQS